MDFAQVLMELWRRRVWMAAGVVVAVIAGLATAFHLSLFPPALEPKRLELGTAQTQLLVDTPRSALGDLRFGAGSFKALSERATVYANLMTSRPVRQAIAEEVGVRPSQLVLEGPSAGQTRAEREPDARERTGELLGEDAPYVLSFASAQGSPAIRVLAQAPSGEDAVRLANGAARGFRKFIGRLGREQGIPRSRRATVRQLGRATGGTVAQGINVKLAFLAFSGTLLLWTLLVLLASNVADSMQRLRLAESGADGPARETP